MPHQLLVHVSCDLKSCHLLATAFETRGCLDLQGLLGTIQQHRAAILGSLAQAQSQLIGLTKAALPPALHMLSTLAQRHNLTQLTRLYYSLPLPALNCSKVRRAHRAHQVWQTQ
jgi:hypothetical protein